VQLFLCAWRLLYLNFMQMLHQCSSCVCFQSHRHFVGRCSTSIAISLCEVCFFVHDFSYVHKACYNWNLHNCCTNITCLHVLEVINILLTNVQHLLQLFVCDIYFFMHNFSCVHDVCCSWILCNCYTNVTYVCVLEVIDILLANVQHLL
jgi:hypothetical protein